MYPASVSSRRTHFLSQTRADHRIHDASPLSWPSCWWWPWPWRRWWWCRPCLNPNQTQTQWPSLTPRPLLILIHWLDSDMEDTEVDTEDMAADTGAMAADTEDMAADTDVVTVTATVAAMAMAITVKRKQTTSKWWWAGEPTPCWG